MGIPENIKTLRARERLSQQRLATKADVSQQLISQLERGENLTTKYLPQIARALNATISEVDPNFDAATTDGPIFVDVPQVSWVSAGGFGEQITQMDFSDAHILPEPDLPAGQWIALKVDGPSMNKISPPESIIFVNLKDKRLVANACYVIADETGAATYKRYRPNMKPAFQPASYEKIAAPKLEGAITVIGRVRRSKIDM